MKENGLVPSPKKDISSPPIQKFPKKFEIFPAPNYKIQKFFFAPQKKYLCVGGGYMPWKIRMQRQTVRKLLGQGIKSEKW